MRQRVAVMKEKVRLAQEDMDSISSKLEGIRKMKLGAQDRKKATQTDLRTLEHEALQCRMALLNSPNSNAMKRDLADAEMRVQLRLDKLNRLVENLHGLEEEEQAVVEDLESAKESQFGAQQVLAILESQLNSF